MDSRCCMNVACGTSSAPMQWRRDWVLRSGDFAVLCDKCGRVYEQSKFCDVFHSNNSGWRQCDFCGKYIHCGCIASQYLFELQDTGRISCIICARHSRPQPVVVQTSSILEKHDGSGTSRIENVNEVQGTSVTNQFIVRDFAENDGMRCWLKPHNDVGTNASYVGMKQDEILLYIQELGSSLVSYFHQGSSSIGLSLAQTNLSMTLGPPLGNSNPFFHSAIVDEREKMKTSLPILHGPNFSPILPMFPLSTSASGLEENNASMAPRTSVAMAAPTTSRGRNQQLIARYWPRITDEELQQISRDSNSTVMPLFEKVLSASDTGPIGRIVLPKACAEAYLPPISQPEGFPLQIHDVQGNVWFVQFRFWPNNDRRIYVLERVSPCIEFMQLKAGDAVTFSRMDPETKVIMTVRRKPPLPPPCPPPPSLLSAAAQSLIGSSHPHPQDTTTSEGRKGEGLDLPAALVPKKKITLNIGSKNKRLHIETQDALELRVTWEEAQDLLLPPPAVNPSVVMIDDLLFEEYEDPPIIRTRRIFIVRSNRINEQWAECDSCSKWRKLPVDILLPAEWTCVDNIWDQSRCTCSAPSELTAREVDNLVNMKNNKGFKKQRVEGSPEPTLEHESSGLHTLADAALLEVNAGDHSRTKHTQHVPGCSCNVCVQQPSGKGKHKASCTCNACMAVKNQIKTLMMQEMNRQAERQAGIGQRNKQFVRVGGGSEGKSTSQISKKHPYPCNLHLTNYIFWQYCGRLHLVVFYFCYGA